MACKLNLDTGIFVVGGRKFKCKKEERENIASANWSTLKIASSWTMVCVQVSLTSYCFSGLIN